MYGSEIYRIFPSCADPALLPAFVYTIVLYILTAICVFFTGCDEFTGVKEFNYPDWIVYRSTDSDIPDSREFAIAIDEWNVKCIGTGFGGVAAFNEKK